MNERLRIIILETDDASEEIISVQGELVITADVRSVCEAVESLHDQISDTSSVMFIAENLNLPTRDVIASCLASTSDAWHSGLHQGLIAKPEALDSVLPQWMFTTDPRSDIEATSWRMSWRGTLVRAAVIQQLGFIDPTFETLDAAFLDIGHRWLRRGASVRNRPGLFPELKCEISIPIADQLRFLQNRVSSHWARWALFRMVVRGEWPVLWALRSAARHDWRQSQVRDATYSRKHQHDVHTSAADDTVAVIIPTLHRYAYLRTLLSQLSEQSHPPAEIIVIDQTDFSEREQHLSDAFPEIPMKVIHLDIKGQCTARNSGIIQARSKYLLLLDDDVEVQPDFIERHIHRMHMEACDSVSGIIRELNAGALNKEFLLQRVSDVLPAGNSLLHRNSLERTGLFDLAYDKGQRADGDLGFRLYAAGAYMVLDPDISILHHRAPSGGLREHGARKVTRASGRRSFIQWNLLTISDFYMLLRYCGETRLKEARWINLLSLFSVEGGFLFHVFKGIMTSLFMPYLLFQLRKRERAARVMLLSYPIIPLLPVVEH